MEHEKIRKPENANELNILFICAATLMVDYYERHPILVLFVKIGGGGLFSKYVMKKAIEQLSAVNFSYERWLINRGVNEMSRTFGD